MSRILLIAGILALSGALGGCGVLAGAGAAGAAYETQNKQALEDLEQEFKAGRINRDEYLERRQLIEEKSAVY